MAFALLIPPDAPAPTGPDLTRYLFVCVGLIVALVLLAWVFRRFVAGQLRARAAKRSMQVLDVLPLSGKQKLVVVRCYDRSFLLGLGEKEVRAIAELDAEAQQAPAAGAPFSAALDQELTPRPGQTPPPARRLDPKSGVLA